MANIGGCLILYHYSQRARAIMSKRLFIFAGYDKLGRVDATLTYYLRALSKLGDIVFVMDNDLPDSELAHITQIPNVLYAKAQRHGEYDFGSYKRGYIWARDEKIFDKYDWVYLVNDSVFGPVFDLKPVLMDLESRGADFIGMVYNTNPTMAAHIQSWFIGFNQKIISSDVFDEFITSVKHEREKSVIVFKYEIYLTQLLVQHGYKPYGLYHDTDAKMYTQPAVVLQQGVPFIKKLSFQENNKIQLLYSFLSPELIDNIIEYANKYGIALCSDEKFWTIPYHRAFRATLFGIPLLAIRRQVYKRNTAYKIYLFDVIPVMKLSFNSERGTDE